MGIETNSTASTIDLVHELSKFDALYIILITLILLLLQFFIMLAYVVIIHMAVPEKLPSEYWYFNAFWEVSKPIVLALALETLVGTMLAVGVGMQRSGDQREREVRLRREEDVRLRNEHSMESDEEKSDAPQDVAMSWAVFIRGMLGIDD